MDDRGRLHQRGEKEIEALREQLDRLIDAVERLLNERHRAFRSVQVAALGSHLYFRACHANIGQTLGLISPRAVLRQHAAAV